MTQTNAADRKQVRAAEKAAAIAERERGEVVVEMMATPQRRRYVWDKLTESRMFETTYNDDPGRMAYLEGFRAAGIALMMDVMQYCPDQFILAMREANGRRTESDTIANARTSAGPGDTGERTRGEEPGRELEDQPDSFAGPEDTGHFNGKAV